MTKKFCDICEEPVHKFARLEVETPVGEATERWDSDAVKMVKRKTKITTKVVFGFKDHETGFGGPPDLCLSCAKVLVGKLQKQLN